MFSEGEVREVAQAFANALDHNEFERAITMLAPTCRYDLSAASFTSESVLIGPTAIIESCRWHDARARNLFDRVEYYSVVAHVEGMTAIIRFSDVLEKLGVQHTYSCRQSVSVNQYGLVDGIVQEARNVRAG